MSLYDDLGVPPDADDETIKRAHRAAAKRRHPDMPGGDADKFNAATRAYVVLRDPDKRAKYDRTSDANDEPNNDLAQISAIVVSRFEHIIATQSFERTDIIAVIIGTLDRDCMRLHTQIFEIQAGGAKFESAKKRLNFKGGAPNILLSAIEQRISEAKQNVATVREQIRLHRAAAEHLKLYGWSFDVAPLGLYGYITA